MSSYEDERAAVDQLRAARTRIGAELGKVIVGQAEAVDQLLTAVLAGAPVSRQCPPASTAVSS